jgi:hypothetical protein
MQKETFSMSARLFKMKRDSFITTFASIGESDEEIKDIKDAMEEGSPYEEYRTATVIYLNAMINNQHKIFRLVHHVCGDDLFKKLTKAGLREP